ncbi:hypothetical protein [Thiorhodococcus fuscus]|uniref:YfhO family protein n=1 Tax=Thiorhodococcus fuscus TaxID=527200 RepID=A0ABW4YED8_9GAMM
MPMLVLSRDLRPPYLTWPFLALAVLFVSLAVIGGFRSYTPTPFWDSWGIYQFVEKVSTGDLSAWWALHNEHRILLTRVLQWLDIRLFDGSMVFLVAINYAMASAICLLFLRALADAVPVGKSSGMRLILACLICALSFSWLQMENFTWDYQSQFFGAQLFPLLGFYALYRARRVSPFGDGPFIAAVLAGILSVGTMANGILALPAFAVLAWIYGAGRVRVGALVAVSILMAGLYLLGYHTPGGQHSSLFAALIEHPVLLANHTLIYLGGPIYHLLGMRHSGLALVVGLFVVLSALFLAVRSLRDPRQHALELALLAFVAYVIGTALITSAGRIHFFEDRPYLPSRYMTPVLMAWSALLIAFAARFAHRLDDRRLRPIMVGAALALLLLLTPFQFLALQTHDDRIFLQYASDLWAPTSHEEQNFSRSITALALELGVQDSARITATFPEVDMALALARPAIAHGWSAFGDPLLADAGARLGTRIGEVPGRVCLGHLDGIAPVDGDARYLRFSGWIYARHDTSVPRSVLLVGRDRRILGYALTGRPRPDVERAVGGAAALSGFEGFLPAGSSYAKALLVGSDPDCRLTLP